MPLKAIESFIVFKVNDEIITNTDLDMEYRYLFILNNEIKNMNKEIQLKLARESIIREKIKTNELLRYYKLDSSKKYLDIVVKDFYERLDIENLDDLDISPDCFNYHSVPFSCMIINKLSNYIFFI